MPKSPDDLEGLKAERAAADKAYNDALTQLDAALQKRPANLPSPPPDPDVHQLASLNTLWEIAPQQPPADAGTGIFRARFAAAVRRIVAPMFERQQAFNGALVDHLNRNVPVQHASGLAIDGGLAVLRGQLAELARFQTLLIVFLQQITPYVDTRDRDVAGLLRGLSGAIDAVSNEVLKRSEALLAHDRQHDRRLSDMETELQDLRRRLAELQERFADERSASRPPR
jgi:hypothetical protein